MVLWKIVNVQYKDCRLNFTIDNRINLHIQSLFHFSISSFDSRRFEDDHDSEMSTTFDNSRDFTIDDELFNENKVDELVESFWTKFDKKIEHAVLLQQETQKNHDQAILQELQGISILCSFCNDCIYWRRTTQTSICFLFSQKKRRRKSLQLKSTPSISAFLIHLYLSSR